MELTKLLELWQKYDIKVKANFHKYYGVTINGYRISGKLIGDIFHTDHYNPVMAWNYFYRIRIGLLWICNAEKIEIARIVSGKDSEGDYERSAYDRFTEKDGLWRKRLQKVIETLDSFLNEFPRDCQQIVGEYTDYWKSTLTFYNGAETLYFNEYEKSDILFLGFKHYMGDDCIDSETTTDFCHNYEGFEELYTVLCEPDDEVGVIEVVDDSMAWVQFERLREPENID